MAREVITRILCDVCLSEDDRYAEASETPPITIGAAKPRVLALCADHWAKVYEPLRALLLSAGTIHADDAPRFPGTSPGSGVFPCPDPSCHKHEKPFKHEQSLRNHARNVHDSGLPELRAKHAGDSPEGLFPGVGEDKPLAPPKVTEAKCDVEGCDVTYAWPVHKRPTIAMSVHRARSHGIAGARKGKPPVGGVRVDG